MSTAFVEKKVLFAISAHLEGHCRRHSLQKCIDSIEHFHPEADILVICNSCLEDNPQLLDIEGQNIQVIHNDPKVTRRGFELAALYYAHENRGNYFDFTVLIQHTTYLVRQIPFASINCSFVPFYYFHGLKFDTAEQLHFADIAIKVIISEAKQVNPLLEFHRKHDDPSGGGVFGPNFIISQFGLETLSKWNFLNIPVLTKPQAQAMERVFGVAASWLGCPPSIHALDGEIGDKYPCGFWASSYCDDMVVEQSGLHLAKVWGTKNDEC